MSNRTRRSIRPFTDWLLPETFDGSLVASTPPRGQPDHGQGHSPQPMRHDRRADPRRQSSVVLYRLTAANGLGLTDAVPNRIGELTDGRMRPISFATLLLIFKVPRRAESARPATPRCAFRRRSICCAKCFRPTTEPCTSASSPFSKTRSWVGHSGRLRRGMSALPERMRVIERDLLKQASAGVPALAPTAHRHQPASLSTRRLHMADDRGSRNL